MRDLSEFKTRAGGSTAGFTLIDLLAVIGVLAILTATLVPALAGAKMKTYGAACKANQKQIMTAAILYAEDYNGYMLRVGYSGGGFWPPPTIVAFMSRDQALKEVQSKLKQSLLWGYVPTVETFHCPGDARYRKPVGAGWGYDSYSLCDWVGITGSPFHSYSIHGIAKFSNIPEPAGGAVFVEENDARYYNNGAWAFAVEDHNAPWIDTLAAPHNTAGSIAFADGHVELHRWQTPETIAAGGYPNTYYHPKGNPDPDWVWMIQRWRYAEYPAFTYPL